MQESEPAIWRPWYGIPFTRSIVRFFREYADFGGRASRSEYWWVVVWTAIISVGGSIVGAVVDSATGWTAAQLAAAQAATDDTWILQSLVDDLGSPSSCIQYAISAVLLVPTLTVGARRLHDTARSGWWQLLQLVPVAGGIALIVLFALRSDPAGERYDRPREA